MVIKIRFNKVGLFICLSSLLIIISCLEPKNPYSSLAPGMWRGVLHISNEPKLSLKDEIERYEKDKTRPIHNVEDEIPFLFEVKYENEKPVLEIINGEERIKLNTIYLGRDKTTAEDTVRIDIPVFDSYIKAILKEGILQGDFVVRSKVNFSIPFSARFGKNQRFELLPIAPTVNMSGYWACIFDTESKKPYPAIGEMKQDGSILRGTFRTETGDYRYLDGTVNGDKFYLSCFDGAHAFVFVGKVSGDSLIGTFRSSKSQPEIFTGIKNEKAELKNATEINKATTTPVSFSFLDQNKQLRSLSDYKKDVKILQVMGTWCPNCWDETKFITQYIKDHPEKSIDVIALSCERYRDTNRAIQSIKNYKQNMKLPYDILLASTSTNKDETSKQLPFIDTILSYPTMIVLNKQNQIEFIHTGYDGPATSKHAAFAKDFDNRISKLLTK